MRTFPHKKWNPFIQFDVHEGHFLFLPAPPTITKTYGLHVGGGLLAFPFWGMGSSDTMNDCKIFADGMEIVSRDHEATTLIIPHINLIPPPTFINLDIPFLIAGSSSKCFMASSSVVGTSGPIAVSIAKYVGVNAACSDPAPLPSSLVANWGSVEIGFSLMDLVFSVALWIKDVAMALIVDAVSNKIGDWINNNIVGPLVDSITDKIDDIIKRLDIWDDVAEDWIKEKLPNSLRFLGDLADGGEDMAANLLTAVGELFEKDFTLVDLVDFDPDRQISLGELFLEQTSDYFVSNFVSGSADAIEGWFSSMAEEIL